MIADIVLLPACLEMLRSTRLAEERRRSSCHRSCSMPRDRANATRSSACVKSSSRALGSTITRTLQCPYNGTSGLGISIQGVQELGAQREPLRRDEEVEGGRRLDQLLDLGLQLQSFERLVASEESGTEISFLLGLLLQAVHVVLDLSELARETLSSITLDSLIGLNQQFRDVVPRMPRQ